MQRRLRWLEVPLHPMLASAAFVLTLALENEVGFAGYIRALAVAVVFAGLLVIASWAAVRAWSTAAIIATSAIVLVILPYPALRALQSIAETVGVPMASGAAAVVLFAALGLPALLALRAHRNRERFPRPSTTAMNALMLGLMALVLAPHVVDQATSGPGSDPDGVTPQANELPGALPDIYVILLDGYPRADVLRRQFDYDNTPFLDQLRERGLEVAADSHSNYVFTQLTLATMLEMKHVDEIPWLAGEIGRNSVRNGLLRDAISGATALDVLHAAGYEIVATDSGYEHASLRGASDRFLSHGTLNDFERALLERTLILDLVGIVRPYWFAGDQRDRIVGAFDDVSAVAASGGGKPRFVLGHIPAPHLPIVTDANGKAVPLRSRNFDLLTTDAMGLTDQQFHDAFRDQLAYLNERVIGILDAIAARASDVPPVVVLMSDHGWTFSGEEDQSGRLANLFAYSTPGAPRLLDGVTPVNFLAAVFNHYLGVEVPLAPNRYFLSPPDPRLLMQLNEVHDPNLAR